MRETFEHTADIGVRGTGRTPQEAFSEAAAALFSVMADVSLLKKKPDVSFSLSCRADAPEDLLVEFLNSLLTQAALRRCVLSDVRVMRMDETGLEALVSGVKAGTDTARCMRTEVKGATYCGLKVAKRGGKWTAQCVVDV